jgi:D-alanyl-D-alanine carboxypeptidase
MITAFALTLAFMAEASANPRYAAYVIDAKTGEVLFARNANDKRYPASLTKMMTLYLTFEALEAGRISKGSKIPVSRNAAAEEPSKLGLRAGSTITVDQAIKALVTKSANDAATALGEFLGGSEKNFARMMTAKARQLGMSRTQFRNAHGLPNSEQYTTARDMAILGIALREHFPNHYSYFSTRSFQFGKHRYGNHNRLLGRVEGVDGIKTGYIRASGFNLVTSVKRDGRSIVGVVMGGQSGRSRDAHMAELIAAYLPKASRQGGGELIASQQPVPNAPVIAGMFALPSKNIPLPDFRPAEQVAQVAQPAAVPQVIEDTKVQAFAYTSAVAARMVPTLPVPAAQLKEQASVPAPQSVDLVNTASTARPEGGWAVQVASSPSKSEAMAFLENTSKQAAGVLTGATPFTETFDNKGTTFFRARFGGFETKDAAWDACNALKKKKIDCYAMQL